MTAITAHDLRRSDPPGQGEVRQLLELLLAGGVDPPAAATTALRMIDDLDRLLTRTTMAERLAELDETATAEDVLQVMRDALADRYLTQDARAFVWETAAVLTGRAVEALTGDVPRILDELRPCWDQAAADVAAGADLGIGPAATAADVITLGDAAVATWRKLDPAVTVLDRLNQLRARLLWTTGHHLAESDLAPGRAAWLDRAGSGPPALTATPPKRRLGLAATATASPHTSTPTTVTNVVTDVKEKTA